MIYKTNAYNPMSALIVLGRGWGMSETGLQAKSVVLLKDKHWHARGQMVDHMVKGGSR